jgi:hypothetical protein
VMMSIKLNVLLEMSMSDHDGDHDDDRFRRNRMNPLRNIYHPPLRIGSISGARKSQVDKEKEGRNEGVHMESQGSVAISYPRSQAA